MDILIVEDEAILALAYQYQLQKLGYRSIGLAFSGEEALQAVERHRPKMILMDIKIQGNLDGIEVAKIIRDLYDIPIIYITAFADKETLARAWQTRPVCILGKVSGDMELARIVSGIVAPAG